MVENLPPFWAPIKKVKKSQGILKQTELLGECP